VGRTTERYTAVIKIVKVREDEGTGRGDDKKWDTELANIVVRNDSLTALLTKVKAHLDLVDE
jgi:hypothetical protein